MAPQRRCAGCGRVADKRELARVALVPAQTRRRREQAAAGTVPARAAGVSVVLDRSHTLPGRGAYICRDAGGSLPSERCFGLAQKRGGIQRTLRSSTKPRWSDLVESDVR
ncbi:MAG: YlxR family protein [Solirubrobacteraceae bacterium]